MKRFVPWIGAAWVAVALLSPRAGADDAIRTLVETRSDAVVAIRFVLNLHVVQGGEARDIERSATATGILVDAEGLLVVANESLAPSIQFPGVEVTTTPTNLRVVFPGDPTEYEAVLGATDSRLGLAFLKIRDLKGRAVVPVDLEQAGDVALGMRVYGVSRLTQGFDHAPYCDTADITAKVVKPRKMWLLSGRFLEIGHPLFDAEGRVLGFVIEQEGVGEGNALRFLLPLKIVKSTIDRAARESARILEEVAEREAEEAAAAAEADSAETPETPDVPETPETPEDPANGPAEPPSDDTDPEPTE